MSTTQKEGKPVEDIRNELERATDKTKKEYIENICDEIMEFQRRGHYDLIYTKTKELSWKEYHGIQNFGIRDKYWKFGRIILQSSTINLINQKT